MTTCVWCGGSTGEPEVTECWRCANERPFVERHHVRVRRMLDAMWDEVLDGPEVIEFTNHSDRIARRRMMFERDGIITALNNIVRFQDRPTYASYFYDAILIHAFEAGDLP